MESLLLTYQWGACGVIGASAIDFPSMLTKLGCEKKQTT